MGCTESVSRDSTSGRRTRSKKSNTGKKRSSKKKQQQRLDEGGTDSNGFSELPSSRQQTYDEDLPLGGIHTPEPNNFGPSLGTQSTGGGHQEPANNVGPIVPNTIGFVDETEDAFGFGEVEPPQQPPGTGAEQSDPTTSTLLIEGSASGDPAPHVFRPTIRSRGRIPPASPDSEALQRQEIQRYLQRMHQHAVRPKGASGTTSPSGSNASISSIDLDNREDTS